MKFGVREICDVVFKATANNQKVGKKYFKAGQPCFKIDTATTSEMTQESTTVYAQGGKGYNRLIAWEGEKTMTFTVTDALMSPMGLAVLTGAGLIDASNNHAVHVHATYNVAINDAGEGYVELESIIDELGLDADTTQVDICTDVPVYGTVLDNSGAGIDWLDAEDIVFADEDEATKSIPVTGNGEDAAKVTITKAAGKTVSLDFYVIMTSGATEITIEPSDFGGYFYVEADTLFRREDNGKDMAATLTFPRVKVQSGFTFTMAASGDPSTFDFTMDAFPGYTYFDRTKKVCVAMTIVDVTSNDEVGFHPTISPAEDHLKDTDTPVVPTDDDDDTAGGAAGGGENAGA